RVASSNGASGGAIAKARSLYLGWSPDGATLVTHEDGDISRVPTARVNTVAARGGATRDLAVRPNSFRAPIYTPDGRTVLIGGPSDNGRTSVLAVPVGGGPTRTVIETEGPPSFLLSPRGDRVAVTSEGVLPGGLRTDIDI